jgi:predicted  nucleic acid-binding Zn-ribbon protein
MKKKIINGLLMMALTVASTSSFVSCTDTVSDDTAALKEMLANQDTRLTAALNQQIALLQQQITDLKSELQNSKCKCEIPFLQEYLDLLNQLNTQLGDINNAINGTGSGGTGMDLASWIAQVNKKLKDLQTQADQNTSDIATNAGNIASLLTQVQTLDTALKALEGRVSANETNIAYLLTCCQTVNGIISTLQTDLADLKTKVGVLESNYTSLNDSLKGLSIDERLKALEGLNIDDRLKALEALNLDQRIQTLESYKVVVDQRFTQISDSLATAYQKINAAETRLTNIEQNFATKQALEDSTAALRQEIDDLWTAATTLYNNELYLLDLIQANQQAIQTNKDAIAAQEITIGQMQQAIQDLQAKDQELEGKITNLETRVANLEPRVAKNEEDIKKIFNALDKEVTGIILQGAYSPVFGIGMLPVDAKTNILAAYVGTSTKAIEFPAMDAANYVNQGDFWTDEEAEFVDFNNIYTIGANQILLSDAADNAGKLYLTVNPSQVDFDGKIITMENSQGKAAPVELAPLKKSDYRLAFGWTRGAQNGFYEADAKISKENLKDAKARINKSALIDAAKDLYHNRNKASLREAAQAIISSNGDILDAQAAKATYEGLDENGNIEEKTTFSEYSIATTVITPLSYNTLRGWNPNRIPGLDRVESVINRFFNKINVKFDFGIKTVAQMPQIDLITIPELDKEYYINVHIKQPIELKDIPVKVPGQWVEVKVNKTLESSVHVEIPYKHLNYATPDPNDFITETLVADVPYDVPIKFDEKVWVEGTTVYFSYTYNLDISQDVDITDIIKDLYGEVTQPIDGVNETLKSLQKFADEVNEMLKSIENLDARVNGQIEDMKNDIKNEIIGYMDRFEKKVLSYASYVNQALQPVLLYKSVDGLNRVSTIEKGASKMTGTVALVPTNFNAELLSPAFKKYVVCTGAWDANGNFDAAAAKAANADSANENFAKVIEGQERLVTFTGKAGYKYRIVYQALDYHGKIASGRYYVQF